MSVLYYPNSKIFRSALAINLFSAVEYSSTTLLNFIFVLLDNYTWHASFLLDNNFQQSLGLHNYE